MFLKANAMNVKKQKQMLLSGVAAMCGRQAQRRHGHYDPSCSAIVAIF